MVRNYVRKTPLEKLAYMKEKPPEVEICIKNVNEKKMTITEMSSKLGITRKTAANYIREYNNNTYETVKVGHPTVFTVEEESIFRAHIIHLEESGFPVSKMDLKIIVQNYLEQSGRVVSTFKKNIPGEGWISGFLSRHTDLSQRFASNISKARTAVNEDVINEYINNLSTTINDVPPENIFNYDEINFTDDLEKKKIICKKGTKYSETINNSSKSSTSIMFCGNAAGKQVSPYIVFKSEHMWKKWTEGGPMDARYNRTSHGWFDSCCFEDWFIYHLHPILKKLHGKKVIIGDNLSSHLSTKVTEICKKENIHFVCLPPNSIDFFQPLDIAYYCPLKIEWRKTLTAYKESEEGRKFAIMPNDKIASLLKTCLDGLKLKISDNLQEGFHECGIYPFDRNQILAKLVSSQSETDKNLIGEAFLKRVQDIRDHIVPTETKRKRNSENH
ncbi:uncharacterized protein LOC127283741 [Leptopilina boulardi]|uniref:uncharacterized protein LOC127283741 n=1 Tax=Leptopilina boulardi TaxID=63433 RepID=UPI0021F5500B|nr:uncharacterized protein LOC127283741 [Leptopilina boulardi]